MTDLDSSNGASYQGMVSYPIVGTDGALKVIRTYLKNLKLIIIGFLSIKI